jgi:hypothetical protein
MTAENPEKKVRIKLSRSFKDALLKQCKPGQGIQDMLIERLGVTRP